MLAVALLGLSIAPNAGDTPYRQPSVAASESLTGVAFGAGNNIYFARAQDTVPVLVHSGGKLALGRHRGPKLAIAGGTPIVAAIVGEKGGGADGDLLVWRSTDGGRNWLAPVKLNDVPGAAREGLHGIAANGATVAAVWLDLREKGTTLYAAVSRDNGATWSKNALVYQSPSGTICQCCHPSVAVAKDGSVYVMFRNAVDGNRDMYTMRLGDKAPVKLGSAEWKLNACPMDGGALALDAAGRPITAWRRESQVYLAGANGAEELIGAGKDPAMAVGRKGAYVVWAQGPELRMRRPGGAEHTLASEGAWASVAALPDGRVLAAWESGGAIRLETLPE
jgi:hypothetical protein